MNNITSFWNLKLSTSTSNFSKNIVFTIILFENDVKKNFCNIFNWNSIRSMLKSRAFSLNFRRMFFSHFNMYIIIYVFYSTTIKIMSYCKFLSKIKIAKLFFINSSKCKIIESSRKNNFLIYFNFSIIEFINVLFKKIRYSITINDSNSNCYINLRIAIIINEFWSKNYLLYKIKK